MEFSQILGFLKILGESMKLVLKNGKSIASITTLSLFLSSSLVLLFGYCYQTTMTYITNPIIMNSTSAVIIWLALLFSVELCFLLAISAIAHASGMATILATATSYFDTKTSLQDLFSMVRTKWRSPFTFNFFHLVSSSAYSCRHRMMYILCIVAVSVAVPLVMFNPNPITITIVSVVGVSLLVFQLYASVVWVLAGIIPVVEDGCEAAEAMEKAEKLVQGQRLHGFMLNLLSNVISLIILFRFWMIVYDKGSLQLVVYCLFLINYSLLTRIFGSVVYTVYYFQCKEYHGEKLQALLPGNFHYTTVYNDIP